MIFDRIARFFARAAITEAPATSIAQPLTDQPDTRPTHFAVLHVESGHFVRSGIAPARDVDAQPVNDGEVVLKLGPDVDHNHRVDFDAGEIVEREPHIDVHRVARLRELQSHHASLSSAVWRASSGRSYPGDDAAARIELAETAIAGGLLRCVENGIWDYRPHTAEEARAVLAEFVTRRDRLHAHRHAAERAIFAADTPGRAAAECIKGTRAMEIAAGRESGPRSRASLGGTKTAGGSADGLSGQS